MPEITDIKFRRGTSYLVTFPNLPSLDVQPIRVDLYQSQYSHDVLKFRYNETSEFWFSLLNTGELVKFEWVRGSIKGEWFGYVYLVSKENNSTRRQEMEIQCIGATFPLKNQVTRIFEDKSVTEIAALIAKENGFHFVGEEDGRKFPQLMITGQSYWEWLSQQARKIGYGLVIDGMTMIFRPLDKLIDQSMSSIPILSLSGTQLPNNAQFEDKTLDWFKVLNGEHIENGEAHRAIKFVGGIDPHTGNLITTSSSPNELGTNLRNSVSDVLFSEQRTDQVINDLVSAKSAADGAAHLARFNLPAKVRAQGDSRLRPFSPVYIQGTGELTDGYWMVKQITHKFALVGDYQIEMDIVTDGLGTNASSIYRNSSVSRVGTIALNVDGDLSVYTPNNKGSIGVTIEAKGTPVAQLNRGYLRTPSRWISVGK